MRNIDQGDYVSAGTVLAVVQKDDYQQKLDQAKASLVKAQADHERAKLSFERMSVLYKAGAATQPDYDDTPRARSEHASRHRQRQRANRRSPTGSQLLRPASAPFDSWVLKRNVDLGTLVSASHQRLLFGRHANGESSLRRSRHSHRSHPARQPADRDDRSLQKTFSGHVTAISAGADPKSRVYSVEVRIDNPENLLKAGMIASITIGTPVPAGGVMVVPISAVVRSPANQNGFAVFVTEGTGDVVKVRTQDVTLGNTYGNMIAVKSGLSLDQRVVTEGTNMIRNGEEIRIIP